MTGQLAGGVPPAARQYVAAHGAISASLAASSRRTGAGVLDTCLIDDAAVTRPGTRVGLYSAEAPVRKCEPERAARRSEAQVTAGSPTHTQKHREMIFTQDLTHEQ